MTRIVNISTHLHSYASMLQYERQIELIFVLALKCYQDFHKNSSTKYISN